MTYLIASSSKSRFCTPLDAVGNVNLLVQFIHPELLESTWCKLLNLGQCAFYCSFIKTYKVFQSMNVRSYRLCLPSSTFLTLMQSISTCFFCQQNKHPTTLVALD